MPTIFLKQISRQLISILNVVVVVVVVVVVSLSSCSADTTPRATIPAANSGSAATQAGTAGSTAPGNRDAPPPPITTPAPPTPGASCGAISQRAMNQRAPADIIIAVDNSGSMDEEIAFVRDQLNAFSQQITASGVDARIILISAPLGTKPRGDDDDNDNGICIAAPLGSGTCPDDSKAPSYFHVPQKVGSNDPLNLIIDTFPDWRAQLRPNASKTFVVVTDDDATDRPNDSAATFTKNVANLPGGLFPTWTLSGIYCFSECDDAAAIGLVYDALVKQTLGVGGDLCEQNFAPVFDALAKQVVSSSGLDCAWDIPAPPAGQAFDRQKVNVQYATAGAAPSPLLQVASAATCGTRTGWHFDDPASPKRILVCPTTCDALQHDPQATIDVLFGCETQVAPD